MLLWVRLGCGGEEGVVGGVGVEDGEAGFDCTELSEHGKRGGVSESVN